LTKGRVLVAIYRVHWGLSSRAPWGSIVQPSYLLPPPTTVVGALARSAYSLGVLRGGEFVRLGPVVSGAFKLMDKFRIRWVTSAWLSPVTRVGIPIAYFAAPYRAIYDTVDTVLEKRQPPRQLFSFLEVGYVVAPQSLLAIAMVVEADDEECRNLLDVAMHVSRIGSKESFVDPLYVALYETEEVTHRGNVIRTGWLTLRECFNGEIEGSYTIEKTPMPLTKDEWLCWYSVNPCIRISKLDIVREAVHPRYPGWVRASLSSRCRALVLKNNIEHRFVSNSAPKSLPRPLRTMLILGDDYGREQH